MKRRITIILLACFIVVAVLLSIHFLKNKSPNVGQHLGSNDSLFQDTSKPIDHNNPGEKQDESLDDLDDTAQEDSDAPKNEFTVAFLDQDESLIQSQVVNAGESGSPPLSPVRDGYVFVKWDKPLENIQSDMVVHAEYRQLTGPTIAVENVYARKTDDTVSVTVSVLNNPGIASLLLDLDCGSYLKLEKIELAEGFGEYATAPEPFDNPQTISMVSPFEDNMNSGVFATLTFSIDKQNTTEIHMLPIAVTFHQDNTFNSAYKDVYFETVNGSITLLD